MGKPIQVQPRGLLGFFQLKNYGQNPSELIETVQPTLETLEWYAETNSEITFTNTLNPVVVGNFDAITVPDNEYWIVLDFNSAIGLGVGDAAEAALYFKQGGTSGSGTLINLLSDYRAFTGAVAGNAQWRAPELSARKLILSPGGRLGINFRSFTGVLQTTPWARIARCRG